MGFNSVNEDTVRCDMFLLGFPVADWLLIEGQSSEVKPDTARVNLVIPGFPFKEIDLKTFSILVLKGNFF